MDFIRRFRQLPPGRKATFLAGAFFLLLYFSLGLLFLLVKNLPFDMAPAVRIGFGALLLLYSAFRFSRLVKGVKRLADEESTNL